MQIAAMFALTFATVSVANASLSTGTLQVSGYGSNGLDGALVVSPGEVEVLDLSTMGTFDQAHWVVRFDFTQVQLGAGSQVRFLNHPSRAPVAWIVSGNVSVEAGAQIILDGSDGTVGGPGTYAEPGPGGFRGGRGGLFGDLDITSAGFGPGGARGDAASLQYGGSGGSYRTKGLPGGLADAGTSLAEPYGRASLVPLIGGSGGGAGRRTFTATAMGGGGAGGGALLIAADGAIVLDGGISARGGAGASALANGAAGGGGSGGAVRLASLTALSFGPGSSIDVSGGSGGEGAASNAPPGGNGSPGRIRLEAPLADVLGTPPMPASLAQPEPAFAELGPRVWVVSIGGQLLPPDDLLGAGLGGNFGSADLTVLQPGIVDVVVQTSQLPEGAHVFLRITRATGSALELGPEVLGPGQSTVTFQPVATSAGFVAVQARAVFDAQ